MPASTIEEVITQLDEIIARSRREKSRVGFFAALYRQVTMNVKEGIASDRFEDGARMERLDVIFANRYLEALQHFRAGTPTGKCWQAAFQAAPSWRLLILQHLLLGINAHINLDLGAAAAQTCPGENLPALKRDFEEINAILSDLLDKKLRETPMTLCRIFFITIILTFAATPSHSQLQIQPAFPNLTFTYPVDLQSPGDGTDRIFVVEQPGVIQVFDNISTVAAAKVFLDISDRVEYGGEMGLLGLAFHPNYQSNGYFYVNYTTRRQGRLQTFIARYRVKATDINEAEKDSELVLLEFDQPYTNHNGGQIAFGPTDGYLYIATGDGGSGGDPQGNGQSLRTLLGKILRIDVNTSTGNKKYGIPSDNPFVGNTDGNLEEIYAYGLRNPWRFSFDPTTAWLWTGDVGQRTREEIDLIEKGKNYGWNLMEGNLCYPSGNPCDLPGLTKPVLDYGRSLGASVTGGYVYRGKQNPELIGAYIHGDYISGRLWLLRYDESNPPSPPVELPFTVANISSFGIDKNNELYICSHHLNFQSNSGRIYRFKPTASSVDDNGSIPVSNRLAQNYPNPFVNVAATNVTGNRATTIEYAVTQAAQVEINLFNLQGQLVRTLVSQSQIAGKHVTAWDGRDGNGQILPNGTYLYHLKIGGNVVETKRLLLIK
jgi:glucose/arabinose dehydrogenase